MKRIMRIKAALLLLVAAAALSACISDLGEIKPDQERVSENVTFKINVPANNLPKTRAMTQGDEYAVSDIAVLAFDNSTKKLKGRYTGRIVDGPTHISGASATMTFEVSLPKGELDMMIVANANAMLNDCSSLTVDTNQATIEEALKMSMTSAGWNSSDESPTLIPMWGYVKGVNVPDSFPVSTICLTRMVAKVDVQLGGGLMNADGPTEEFKLQEVYVYNYAEQGRLIPYTDGTFDWTGVTYSNLANNQTPSMPTGYSKADADTDWLKYSLASPYSSLTNEIYLFEAPAGVKAQAGSDAYWNNTCLVIGGSYRSGSTTYYRIDFAKRTDEGAVTTYSFLPILRNNSYTVTITGISGNGHASPEDALHSAPTNITASILDWNNNDITSVITDGVFMLGLSQGSFELLTEAYTTDSYKNTLTVVSNNSRGWAATVWADEAGTTPLANEASGKPWLSLTASSGNGNYPNGNDIRLIASQNDSGSDRTAYIHIKAGTLRYVVKVKQLSIFLRITHPKTGEEMVNGAHFQSNSKNSTLGKDLTDYTNYIYNIEWSSNETLYHTSISYSGTSHYEYPGAKHEGFSITSTAAVNMRAKDVAPPNEFLSLSDTIIYKVGNITKYYTKRTTHYQLIPNGFSDMLSPKSDTTRTVYVRCNAPWVCEWSADLYAGSVIAPTSQTLSGPANTATGVPITQKFAKGTAGTVTYTFSSPTDIFDPVTVTFEIGMAHRFARSNIVLKDGKLTFAETEEDNNPNGSGKRIPANVTGLQFMSASLIGLHAYSLYKAYTRTPFEPSQVVFSPKGYAKPTTWEAIPYHKATATKNTIPYPYDTDDFIKAYPGTGYNVSAGKGDICRYISDQPGWVEGRWRMPTAQEYLDLMYESYKHDSPNNYYGIQFGKAGWAIIPPNDNPNYGMLLLDSGALLGPCASMGDDASNMTSPDKGRIFIPFGGHRSKFGGSISDFHASFRMSTSTLAYDRFETKDGGTKLEHVHFYMFYLNGNTDGLGVPSSAGILDYDLVFGSQVRCIRDK